MLNDSSNNDRYLKDSLRDFHVGVSWFESSAGREDEKKSVSFLHCKVEDTRSRQSLGRPWEKHGG